MRYPNLPLELSNALRNGTQMSANTPTLVLVHGALTDASVWHDVIAKLHQRNLRVSPRQCQCADLQAMPPTCAAS